MAATAQAEPLAFGFGVIAHAGTSSTDDAQLRDAIQASDADNLAFVVAGGIKAAAEPCSDSLFLRRKELFQSAKNGLIVSLGASDWSACRDTQGRSLAIERLNRIRDLFFESEFSLGATKVPVLRQANTPKFRAYVENVRWDVGSVVFATINLPANNNDFLAAAGRNGEFEDRSIANRDWLHRLFGIAAQRNATGIVLFCDGDPMSRPDAIGRVALAGNRDGFVEIRRQIRTLGTHFKGRVLVVHTAVEAAMAGAPQIVWTGNFGNLDVPPGWLKINVDPALPTLFTIATASGVKGGSAKSASLRSAGY